MTLANYISGNCRLLEIFLGIEGAEEVGDLVVVVVFEALIMEGVMGDMAMLVEDVVEVCRIVFLVMHFKRLSKLLPYCQ